MTLSGPKQRRAAHPRWRGSLPRGASGSTQPCAHPGLWWGAGPLPWARRSATQPPRCSPPQQPPEPHAVLGIAQTPFPSAGATSRVWSGNQGAQAGGFNSACGDGQSTRSAGVGGGCLPRLRAGERLAGSPVPAVAAHLLAVGNVLRKRICWIKKKRL